jgi:hypothetical protein
VEPESLEHLIMKKILLALMLPLSAFAYGNGPYPQPGGGGVSTNNVISIVNSGQTAAVTNGQDGVSLGAANDKTNTFGGELVNLGKRVQSGFGNDASGLVSSVGGGAYNYATGDYSYIAGGNNNTASGLYSFAAGRIALATNDSSFVWSRGIGQGQGSDSNGTFTVNASATRLFGGPIYGDGSGLTNLPASPMVDIPLSSVALSSGAHFTNSANSQLGYFDANHFNMDNAIIVPTNSCTLGFPIPNGYGYLTTTLNLTFLTQTNSGFSVALAYSLLYNNAGRTVTSLSAGHFTVTNAVSGACFQTVGIPVTWADDTSIREINETFATGALPVYLIKVTCTMSN